MAVAMVLSTVQYGACCTAYCNVPFSKKAVLSIVVIASWSLFIPLP